jgi:outer membrane protein assembly factor BamD
MRRLLPALLAVAAFGCASGGDEGIATLASNSERVIWKAAEDAAGKRQWEHARQLYRRIIDGFPQSVLGPEARLALADSYFNEGGTAAYILAVSAYREFLTFYPNHEKSAYAQFQVAESFNKQRNPPDRDQTATGDTLAEYQRLLELFGTSEYAETARERVGECRYSLARSEFLVGHFYQRTRKAYRAAIARYEGLLSKYPDYTDMDEVLLRLSEALAGAARPAEALPYLARLLEEYPDSDYAEKARLLMDELQATPPPDPAAPQPSPSPPEALPEG